MRGWAAVFLGLVILGILIKIWPVLLLVAVVALVATGIKRRKSKAQRVREAERAEQISTHRAALAYWQTQVHEADTPAAKDVAQQLVAFNQQCLRDLEQ